MSVMLAAKAKGVENIYVTDLIDERLAIARKKGSCTGNPEREDIVEKIMHEENHWVLILLLNAVASRKHLIRLLIFLNPEGNLLL